MARPVKYTPQLIEKIKSKMEKYINETDIPILAEFAYKNDIPREQLYKIEGLKPSIKKMMDKKEAELEKFGLKQNNTMAIFSLKQLGWKDRQEAEINLPEKIVIELPAEMKQ